jgi:hypothetical protein
MFERLESAIGKLGIKNGLLYLLGRVLQRISNGHWRLIRYYIVAQPVPSPLVPKCAPTPRSTVERALSIDDICCSFPRPKDVIESRFSRGHTVLVAKVKGRFAGYLWYARGFYEEDEVRCRFILADPAASAWDFDVYVEPQLRMGRTLARLWDAANESYAKAGVRWSFSRISAFNESSLSAHGHLGILKIDTLTFACFGNTQFTFTSGAPYVHCSLSSLDHPAIFLRIPDRIPPSS